MKTLILTGGGSAGHVVPNIALIPALREKFNLVYIGSDGIERDLMKGRGVPYHTVHCTKLVRGSVLKNIAMPFRFLKSVSEAKRALAAAGADIVFSKGGYVALPEILQSFDFLHIRGKHAGAEKREGYVPLEYESDMANAYAAADFVVSRAGSNTVFELLALKKPALLVPLENRRSRGDQLQNAQYFEKRGLCRILRESGLSPRTLLGGVRALAADEKLKQNLAAAPFSAGNGSIAELICDTADK